MQFMSRKAMRVTTKLVCDWNQLLRQNKETGFGIGLSSSIPLVSEIYMNLNKTTSSSNTHIGTQHTLSLWKTRCFCDASILLCSHLHQNVTACFHFQLTLFGYCNQTNYKIEWTALKRIMFSAKYSKVPQRIVRCTSFSFNTLKTRCLVKLNLILIAGKI